MRPLPEIADIVEEKLRFMRLFLYDIKYGGTGKRAVLRIYIDKPGGVTIDDCEEASNALAVVLDVENFSDKPYVLEVSSPGLDRKLVEERHFKTVIGHYLRLNVRDHEGKNRVIVGKLIACENNSVTLELDDEQTVCVPLPDVINGNIDIRFQ